MTDETTLEDIFEIGEQLLDDGADPGAVACARGVMEAIYGRYHIIPRVVPVHREGRVAHLSLDYQIKNYYYAKMNITGPNDFNQIVGWSDGGGRLENGEKFWDAGEFWFKDLDAYLERFYRRQRYIGSKAWR